MYSLKQILPAAYVVFLVGCGSSSSMHDTDVSEAESKVLQIPEEGTLYFGAFPDFGGSEETVTVEKIRAFEALAGKKIAWAVFSQNWYGGITYPKSDIDAVVKSGSIPYVRLMPRSDEIQGHAERHFSMQHIIDGMFDAALRNWAKAAKRENIALLMDFAVEANGDWFPWSGIFNGGAVTDGYGDPDYPDGPERYRDAYRHIIDIFREENVTNVTWFFHFNLTSLPDEPWNQPRYYYPGDDYIDWVGFSAYGPMQVTEDPEGLLFSEQLEANAEHIADLHTQNPFAVLEFGMTDDHPSADKAVWFDDAFATILENPYVTFHAINPWHENWENEDETLSTLRVDSSPEVLATFRKWIADERFISELRFE